jgi:sugar/nucleoside kinase (ribokinase family)
MGMNDVVGISSLNVDYIYEAEDLSFLEAFHPEGGNRREWALTDSEKINKIKTVLQEKARLISKTGGGSAANTVYSLAKIGFKSGIVGKIGKDADADFLLKEIDIIPLKQIARNQWTGNALIVLGPKRDRTIILIPNANRTLVWADLDLDFIRSFSMMHMTSLLGEGLKLQERLAGEVAGKVLISFDPGEVYASHGLAPLTPLLSQCEILFITEAELQMLTGLPMLEAVSVVQSTGTKIIVIKRKGAGASIVQGKEFWELPAEIIQAKDTTGAGDVFAAGFLGGLLKGQSLPVCGHLGLAMAHQSMMGLGRDAYPGAEDFERSLQKLKD